MADERDEIRERISIVQLVGQRVSLKKAGKDWKGLCPFHDDKNPSFTVNDRTGTYRCWSCGEHGDMFNWVMKTQNVDFVEALSILAEQAGVTLAKRGQQVSKTERATQRSAMEDALGFFQEQLGKSAPAKEYLDRRGLDDETVKLWELGYAPDIGGALANILKKKGYSLAQCKSLFLVDEDAQGGFFDKFRGRLIFPIRDERGELVAFGGRLLGDGVPKYINSGDTPIYRKSRVLYGMYRAKDALNSSRRAVLTEGYLDVIACQRAGVGGAVASLGTALSEDHAKLLKRWCDEVVILYDSDPAGQKAAERAIEVLGAEGVSVKVALMPAGDDPDTLLRSQGAAAVQRSVEQGQAPLDFKISRLLERGDPKDVDGFWPEMTQILASAPNEMELDRHVVPLAALYPGHPDPLIAQKALKREVNKVRRARRGSYEARPRPPAPTIRTVKELLPSETTLLRAFLEEGHRAYAWPFLGEVGLFLSTAGAELVAAIIAAFPEGPPEGEPRLWLHLVEPEEHRELLLRVGEDPRLDRLTQLYIADAISRLHEEAERRSVSDLRKGGSSLEVMARLKQLKPSYEKDTSE